MPNNYKGLNIAGLKSTTKLSRVQVEPTIDFVEIAERGLISENPSKLRTAGAGHQKRSNASPKSAIGTSIDMGGLWEPASEYDYGNVSADAFAVEEDSVWIKRRNLYSVTAPTAPSIEYDTTLLIKGVFNPLSASPYDNFSVSTADGTLDGTERGPGLGPVAGTSFDANESPYASGAGATYHLSNHYYKIGSDYYPRTGGFTGAFTFEMWIKCEALPPTTGGNILGYDGNQGGNKIYIGNSGNGNKLYFHNWHNEPRACDLTRHDIGDGNWHHIAWTRDDNLDSRVFYDGVQKNTSPTNANTNYYNPITFPDASWNDTRPWHTQSHPPYIHCAQTSGWTTDVRWINGGALYTSSFTPPTAPLTAIP
jgi:hypothetical protein